MINSPEFFLIITLKRKMITYNKFLPPFPPSDNSGVKNHLSNPQNQMVFSNLFFTTFVAVQIINMLISLEIKAFLRLFGFYGGFQIDGTVGYITR